MEGDEGSSSNYSIGRSAQERGLPHVPECYTIPPSHRASLNPDVADVLVVDLAGLQQDPPQRSIVIDNIGNACRRFGFFQITNHGISQPVLDGALSSAFDFFDLPAEEKLKYMSNNVHTPVRYGTSLKDGVDEIQFWRVFLKHYAHPLKDWVGLWPQNPPNYSLRLITAERHLTAHSPPHHSSC
ncbi:hypothetical protein L1049_021020 [Liquidambar formosana]|uniref:Non-haem dioxygenase N-terminal domain-containing protein n=1 Tax=Liquidambar formosana TaxID=63359 RepID=A0AAP0X6L5_LIQFO